MRSEAGLMPLDREAPVLKREVARMSIRALAARGVGTEPS